MPTFSENRNAAPSTGRVEASSTTSTGTDAGVTALIFSTVAATTSFRFRVVTATPIRGPPPASTGAYSTPSMITRAMTQSAPQSRPFIPNMQNQPALDQRRLSITEVMPAPVQAATGNQHDRHQRLSAATVTPVGSIQRARNPRILAHN